MQKKKVLRIVAGIIILIATALWVAGVYLSERYETILREQITANLPESVSADFSSLKINLFKRSVTLESLNATYFQAGGRCDTSSVKTQEIILSGISIIDLIFNKSISVNHVKILNGSVVFYHDCLKNVDSFTKNFSGRGSTLSFNDVLVKNLDIQNCQVSYFNDSASVTTTINSQTKGLKVPLKDKPFNIHDTGSISVSLSDLMLISSNRKYTIRMKTLLVDSERKTIQADSLSIKPREGKFEFAQKLGRQTDRFDLSIPKISIDNIPVKNLADSSLIAGKISIHSADLKVFRDKRLPFIKYRNTTIPANMLRRLPLSISIDSIKIHDASVQYEEFPADIEGTQSGVIRFSAMNASGYNITNRPPPGAKHIDLDVQARFMNSGLLSVSFDIPYDTLKPHRVEGSLRNFELTDLNPMLKHLAMIHVNSGTMTYMPFTFSYNDNISTGEIELNYEKLKVVSLQEKKDGLLGINELKTFLISIFLRKNKNDNMPKEKRTGTISFERDKKRSIFNYLWNSLFTGIKSSYNLESILPEKNKSGKTKKEKKAEGKKRRNKSSDDAPV